MKRSNHEHLRPTTRTHNASQVHRLALRLTMEALSASVCFQKQERLEQLRFLPSSQSTSVFDHQSTTKDDWGCAKRNKPTSGYAQTPTSTRDGREVIENLVRFLRGSGGEIGVAVINAFHVGRLSASRQEVLVGIRLSSPLALEAVHPRRCTRQDRQSQ